MARSLAEHESRILNTRGDELPDQRQRVGEGADLRFAHRGQRLDARAKRIAKLRSKGHTVEEVCEALGITERQFFYGQRSRRG